MLVIVYHVHRQTTVERLLLSVWRSLLRRRYHVIRLELLLLLGTKADRWVLVHLGHRGVVRLLLRLLLQHVVMQVVVMLYVVVMNVVLHVVLQGWVELLLLLHVLRVRHLRLLRLHGHRLGRQLRRGTTARMA